MNRSTTKTDYLRSGLGRGTATTKVEGLVVETELATTVDSMRSERFSRQMIVLGRIFPYVYAGSSQVTDPAFAPDGLQVVAAAPPPPLS